MIKKEDKGAALDAGIVAGAQRAEHYEMAAYGSLMAWAEALGHDDVIELLGATLEEEKAADERLSELAEGGINESAAAEDEEEDEVQEPTSADDDRRSPTHVVSDRQGRR
jgi:ferritin-like metal-binding protein YciE